MKIVSKDLNFKGKRVLITGAASGIGAAMAETFSDHGASLILADINKMDPKIDFWDVFFQCFFCVRFGIDFGSFSGGAKPEK